MSARYVANCLHRKVASIRTCLFIRVKKSLNVMNVGKDLLARVVSKYICLLILVRKSLHVSSVENSLLREAALTPISALTLLRKRNLKECGYLFPQKIRLCTDGAVNTGEEKKYVGNFSKKSEICNFTKKTWEIVETLLQVSIDWNSKLQPL